AALGVGVDDAAALEAQRHARDVDAARARRHAEVDAAARGVLVRAGEDLTRGHVALAVGVDPRATLDIEREVGPRRLDADLARLRQQLDQARLPVGQRAPGGDG